VDGAQSIVITEPTVEPMFTDPQTVYDVVFTNKPSVGTTLRNPT